jgi:two-component system phosphate regulon response regulator OmpR
MTAAEQIILIYDDRAWLETVADFLQGRGFRVRTAPEPRLGLRLLEDPGALAAVVDFRMPEMTGLDLLRLLRRRGLSLPVLMLSSEEDPAVARQVLEAGALAFLSKNTPPRLLLRTLLQFLTAALVEEALGRILLGRADRLLPAPTLYTKANKPHRN